MPSTPIGDAVQAWGGTWGGHRHDPPRRGYEKAVIPARERVKKLTNHPNFVRQNSSDPGLTGVSVDPTALDGLWLRSFHIFCYLSVYYREGACGEIDESAGLRPPGPLARFFVHARGWPGQARPRRLMVAFTPLFFFICQYITAGHRHKKTVIPAQAGIQGERKSQRCTPWIPACAGMTRGSCALIRFLHTVLRGNDGGAVAASPDFFIRSRTGMTAEDVS